ncbi:MAG TPA: L,D-transpeptidase [Longimicrobium sp.]
MSKRKDGEPSFPRAHPVFFWGTLLLAALFLGGAAAVASRVPRYQSEAAELASRMSAAERATRDSVLMHKEKRTQLSVAILRRDVRIRALTNKKQHLALSIEDSVLELRHGPATLRRARVTIGADSTVRAPDGRTWRFVRAVGERRLADKEVSPVYTVPEWVYVSRGEPVPPEAQRQVAGGLGRYVMRLDDGTEIYSRPAEGPLAGTVKPASFMANPTDLAAIFDAVSVETPVYIY